MSRCAIPEENISHKIGEFSAHTGNLVVQVTQPNHLWQVPAIGRHLGGVTVTICPFCGHAKGNCGLFCPKCGGSSNAQTLLKLFLLLWISSVMVHPKVVSTRLVTFTTKTGGGGGRFFVRATRWKP